MIFIAKFLAKILKILNSEISPRQVAAGFAWGVLLGLLPIKGLMPTVLLLLAFTVNINLAAMGLAAALFKIISFIVDPLANALGFSVLKLPALKSLWTMLFNAPLVPYTRFNNTIVMGSLIIGLLLIIPMYFLAKKGIVAYRTHFRDRVMKFRLVQVLKTSALYKYYEMFKGGGQ